MSAGMEKIAASGPENDGPNRAVDTSSTAEPQPPKPPRSAFMCYTDAMKEELMFEPSGNKEEQLKIVAAKWRILSDRQRAEWEEVSRQDKVRFAREKAEYKGPWNIPKRRARKHPLAPKRPMSAFLKYSQKRRKEVKETNPEMNNTDISRLLGEMWRAADASEKEPYVESEKIERAMYNEAIATWREEQAQLDAASRTSHHSVQHSAAIKKPRCENDRDELSDKATTYKSSSASNIDRRIFRPYSGSGHAMESKHYRTDHHQYPTGYHQSDTARALHSKKDPSSYHHSMAGASRSYHSESMDVGSINGPHMVPYPRVHPQHAYRPNYAPMPPHQAENRHQLPNTGSDLFEHTFYDSEPPYNPRQPRSSSQSFPDSYYFP